jgi:NAD-dependent DNA ligase
MELHTLFRETDINERQIDELIGLCHGVVADGQVTQQEAQYLQKWLAANASVARNPVIATLYKRVAEMLNDRTLDDEEAQELYETLMHFTGGDFELGECLKPTTLPVDNPPPAIIFAGKRFCFTGTFTYGSRTICENAVEERGGEAGTLTKATDYLVIGAYATDSWKHSSYGRKIEKAAGMKQKGHTLAIIHEPHWQTAL